MVLVNAVEYGRRWLSSNKAAIDKNEGGLKSEVRNYAELINAKKEVVLGDKKITAAAEKIFFTVDEKFVVRQLLCIDSREGNKAYFVFEPLSKIAYYEAGNPAFWFSLDVPQEYWKAGDYDEVLEQFNAGYLRLNTAYLVPVKEAGDLNLRLAYSNAAALENVDEPSFQRIMAEVSGVKYKSGVMISKSKEGERYRLFIENPNACNSYAEFGSDGSLSFVLDGKKFFNVKQGNSGEAEFSYQYNKPAETALKSSQQQGMPEIENHWQKIKLGYSQHFDCWRLTGALEYNEPDMKDEEPELILNTGAEKRFDRWSAGINYKGGVGGINDSTDGEYAVVIKNQGIGREVWTGKFPMMMNRASGKQRPCINLRQETQIFK